MNAQDHYANHLSHYYSWMAGDFESRKQEQKEFFSAFGIALKSSKQAIDLGAGTGFQSGALAELGFEVRAVDFDAFLLKELQANCADQPIEVLEKSILDPAVFVDISPELIVCMGDTLTHLESEQEVDLLLQSTFKALAPEGSLILSFRDYSHELEDVDRFIPVKNDDHRIFTCFLEYLATKVRVTDLIQEKENGRWVQKSSSYLKLRLAPDKVIAKSRETGFKLKAQKQERGMTYLIFEK